MDDDIEGLKSELEMGFHKLGKEFLILGVNVQAELEEVRLEAETHDAKIYSGEITFNIENKLPEKYLFLYIYVLANSEGKVQTKNLNISLPRIQREILEKRYNPKIHNTVFALVNTANATINLHMSFEEIREVAQVFGSNGYSSMQVVTHSERLQLFSKIFANVNNATRLFGVRNPLEKVEFVPKLDDALLNIIKFVVEK